MNLGLNDYVFVSCDNCDNGFAIGSVVMKNIAIFKDVITCNSCGNKFTYLDGFISSFCSEGIFTSLNFISNIVLHGNCKIRIGVPEFIKLDQVVPQFHKIILTPNNKFYITSPIYKNNGAEFIIISSEIMSSINEFHPRSSFAKTGEEVNLSWVVYGRTKDLEVEPWKQLIVQSKEEFINEKYLLSYLSLAIALESFINSKIANELEKKGIDDKSINIFLKESNMVDKAFVLFKSIINFDVVENGKLSRKKYEEIIQKRNQIAHGKIIKVEKDEVKQAFKDIIKFIMYTETKT